MCQQSETGPRTIREVLSGRMPPWAPKRPVRWIVADVTLHVVLCALLMVMLGLATINVDRIPAGVAMITVAAVIGRTAATLAQLAWHHLRYPPRSSL